MPDIVWNDPETRELFAAAGVTTFEDFWEFEETVSSENAETQTLREHARRGSSRILRRTIAIRLKTKTCFLKRASDRAFRNILTEKAALSAISRFGLVPPRLAAEAFDMPRRRGWLLYENLEGFDAVQDLESGRAPADAVERYRRDKDRFFEKTLAAVKASWAAGYFYPDWRDKHLFIERAGDRLALIDLERFESVDALPFYYKFGPYVRYRRNKEIRTLRAAFHMPPL